MLFPRTAILVTLLQPLLALANTPLKDDFVQNDIATNWGKEIAFASRPIWHFGESRNNKPCYPTSALDGNGAQQPVPVTKWPHAGTGCADPGPKGEGRPFPTYTTVTRCGDNELRVAYNIYYQKDGFSDVVIAKGHLHDWERIIVIWRKNGDTWTRDKALLSYHSGYTSPGAWSKIQNTVYADNTGEQGGSNKDHPKIYTGWAKHANFHDRNTGFNDRISQGCAREFRSRDWWYFPKMEDLIPAGKGTEQGDKMAQMDWGGTTGPWKVEEGICGAKTGGYVAC